MDEIVGMLTIYSVLHKLLPTNAVRSVVAAQVEMLGDSRNIPTFSYGLPTAWLTAKSENLSELTLRGSFR